ncbi:LysM peptidoglycan-binding domain-containing protein, partial [Rhizobacter sp. P5_C2]
MLLVARGDPNFTEIGKFDSSFRSISGSYPKPGSGSYVVVSGDTLQSIARSAYGDSKLWWKIAQANGLGGDDDLRMGQSLMIPSVAGNSNAADVFRPYD